MLIHLKWLGRQTKQEHFTLVLTESIILMIIVTIEQPTTRTSWLKAAAILISGPTDWRVVIYLSASCVMKVELFRAVGGAGVWLAPPVVLPGYCTWLGDR